MSTSENSEHAILTYVQVSKSIEKLTEHHKSLVVKRDSPVSKALNSVVSCPFVSFTLDYLNGDCKFRGPNDTPFGTLGSPNVDAIRAQSEPSSFGKGDQTVTDPAYRDGREIRGKDITCPSKSDYTASLHFLLLDLKTVLEATLFVGKEVDVRLYKLAMYDEGGHFDWHRDSTHGKNHHATVLVALNTSWSGGAFQLRHDGEEMVVDIHPKITGAEEPQPYINLKAVAFYTDVEHKVEPVTSGVRLILQYDVLVCTPKTGPSRLAYTPGEYDFSTLDVVSGKSRMDFMGEDYRPGPPHDNEIQYPSSSPSDVQALVEAVQKVISSGTEEIGIPLRHLYRQSSICKEYLKGVDAVIYAALSAVFDVSLVPVILRENTEHVYSEWTESSEPKSIISVYKVIEGNGDEEDDDDDDEGARKRVRRSTEFHLSGVSDLVEISRKEYIEHTGNEAQEAEYKYFGGGMFIKAKKA
ncbi:uncharacterized protein EV420DRAFT_1682270 [Desarmillaria tabescens]|uniref:Fe2OG dioxygenase domain-containing protein n=1 Tax=Armillaria tabescens TaxID=1929756 RepID=A0AA39KG89_ARMTA|nr:uncharacterized protein EV420DRAFT_1682270 [Desarmillaria tabescens]KAK0458233.1 hypothetical protein EV420DRAFT_1682270 [Desarmillaria tabescens]